MRTAVTVEQARAALRAASRMVALTGAGISAASGIPTFRDRGGLWQGVRPEEVASPQAYARDPLRVWQWYAARRRQLEQVEPNEAHRLLAQLERRTELLVVTQNVDGLHQRAGSRRVLELHGTLLQSRCERCSHRDPLPPDAAVPPSCSRCGARARPDVVWYGELLDPELLEQAAAAFADAEVALVVGTSGVVEPAASLARLTGTRHGGGLVIEINPEQTPLSRVADLTLNVDAGEGLRRLLA